MYIFSITLSFTDTIDEVCLNEPAIQNVDEVAFVFA